MDLFDENYVLEAIFGKNISNTTSLFLPSFDPWLQSSQFLWWYLIVMSFISTFLYILVGVRLLTQELCRKKKLLLAIICSDGIMLIVMGACTALQAYSTSTFVHGPTLCKLMTFASNFSSFFTNWCWFLIWAERFMAVLFPLKHILIKLTDHWWVIIVLAVLMEAWTLMLITEKVLGDYTMCGTDYNLASAETMKWVVLAESFFTYFLPFTMIIIADTLVLLRSRKNQLLDLNVDELKIRTAGHMNITDGAQLRIVPKNYCSRRRKLGFHVMVHTILVASVDLALNLPVYSLNLVDNFAPLRDLIGQTADHIVNAISFVLFYCQYPLILIHVWVLSKKFQTGTKAKPSASTVAMAAMSTRHPPSLASQASRFSLNEKSRLLSNGSLMSQASKTSLTTGPKVHAHYRTTSVPSPLVRCSSIGRDEPALSCTTQLTASVAMSTVDV